MTTRQDLHIRQGADWSFTHTVRDSGGSPVDLTNYTARASIKRSLSDSASAYLSTGADADGGTITLGGVAGTVTLSMTNAETDLLVDNVSFERPETIEPVTQFIYDLELVDASGNVTRELEGRVIYYRGVTS